jgi:hypothetical protein
MRAEELQADRVKESFGDASGDRVCFHVRDDQSGDDDTYKLAVTIASDQSGNPSLGLGPINLSASADRKSATGNSSIVKFGPHDFAKPRRSGDRRGENNFALPGKICPIDGPRMHQRGRNGRRNALHRSSLADSRASSLNSFGSAACRHA